MFVTTDLRYDKNRIGVITPSKMKIGHICKMKIGHI